MDMCEICTQAVHSIELWTRTLSMVWTCVKYAYRSSPLCSTLDRNITTWFRHVWSMYWSSPFRSTLNAGVITRFGRVWSIDRSNRFRSTLNTNVCTWFGHVRSMYRSKHFTMWQHVFQFFRRCHHWTNPPGSANSAGLSENSSCVISYKCSKVNKNKSARNDAGVCAPPTNYFGDV